MPKPITDTSTAPQRRTATPKPPRLRFEFRLANEKELAALQEKAALAGYGANISEYVKRASLGKRLAHRADVEIINELRRLVEEIKDLHANPANPISEDELRVVLQTAIDTMLKV